jgi:hypothetical protein
LEGNSTQNIHTLSKMVESAQESGDAALRSLTIHVNGGQAVIAIPEPEKQKRESVMAGETINVALDPCAYPEL